MTRTFPMPVLAALLLVGALQAATSAHAQTLPTESLKTVPVPEPTELARFVRDRDAAIALGKALFWDMQSGSDGLQACASCHFHSGADSRLKNQVHPGSDGMFDIGGGPNHLLSAADFPFHELADPAKRNSAVLFDTDDVSGSAGVAHRSFNDIVSGGDVDDCDTVLDPVWSIGGVNTRQVTGRNTPSAVNAVFNFRNFWDGRASFFFNGVDPVGPRNPDARILEKQFLTGLVFPVSVLIDRAALASQAVGPPLSGVEMSCDGRTFPKLGKKMLSLTPLAKQLVAITDSALGSRSNALITVGTPGLSTTYKAMIEDAFDPDYWDSDVVVTFAPDGSHVIGAPGVPAGSDEYTMTEANFALFWGLAIQMYESTLVSDDTPFDRFLEGDAAELTEQELVGMNIFFGDTAKCGNCHAGPELSGATTGNVGRVEPSDEPGVPGTVEKLIEIMAMENNGFAAYDSGFYNIGVRPTTEDLGIGGEAAGPICFARRSKLDLPIPEQDIVAAPIDVPPTLRDACDGAFKTPMLRNVEFTAPYFHNGGQFTLEQVVEFYNRGGDFHEANIENLDPDLGFLGLQPFQVDALVAFLKALSDDRVRFEQGPFDHPELFLPVGHPDSGPFLTSLSTGKVEALFVQEGGEFLPAAEEGQELLALAGDALPDTFQRLRATGAEGHCVGIDGSTLGGLPFVASSCDDLDTCTIDFCDPLLECVHLAVSCNDANACTLDQCHQTDGCLHTAVGCDDGNPCTDDFCDSISGCIHIPNLDPCDDADACTVGDTCNHAGACVGGAPLDCRDADFCTADVCDSVSGCDNPRSGVCESLTCVAAGDPVAAFAGAMTADAQFAGGADADAARDSLTSPLAYAASATNAFSPGSGDQVTYTLEVPQAGNWSLWARMYYPGAPGSNAANSFYARVDASAAAKLGNNKDFFQTWHWDGDGVVESGAAAGLSIGTLAAGPHQVVVEKREVTPAGSQPRLDMLCLSLDGAAPPSDQDALGVLGLSGCDSDADCDDGDPCTDDVCDFAAECAHSFNSAPCDDGVACTAGDVCSGGTCAGTDACTAGGVCDAASGICNTPECFVDADCDDGRACSADSCVGGRCVIADVCPAGSVCSSLTGTCETDSDLVCIAAGSDASLLLSGAMATDGQFSGGADADPGADNLTAPLLYADSTQNAFAGGSGDEASYLIGLPETDVWTLWGRFYYPGAPGSNEANSFMVRVDGAAATVFGNNLDTFQRWHWDGDDAQHGAGAGLSLGTMAAGLHEIVVEKREVLPAGKQPRLDVVCLSRNGVVPTDLDAATALGRRFCLGDEDCEPGEVCGAAGVCVAAADCATDADCDDANSCTTDTCDASSGACTSAPVSCDDGDACTVDGCDIASGACSNDPISCDDASACTIDTCDAAAGCRHESVVCPSGEACDAGSGACVAGVVCVAAGDPTAIFAGAMTADGQFAAGADADATRDSLTSPLAYATGTANAFSPGSGVEVTYPISVPETGDWYLWARLYYPGAGGGNAANSFFASLDGGAALKLGNNKGFHQLWHWDGDGAIESGPLAGLALGTLAAGAHSVTVEKREVLPAGAEPRLDVLCLTRDGTTGPDDTTVSMALGLTGCLGDVDCNDGNLCTHDTCDLASGVCSNIATDCSGLDDACNAGVCEATTGLCAARALTGQACDDGLACTVADTCDAGGACVGGAPAACDDGDLCTTDSCDAASGACINTALDCSLLDGACVVGVCDGASGVCTVDPTIGAACDDSNACTTGDACNALGACIGGAPLGCDDGSPCTTDSCDAVAGCNATPVDCGDADVCTADTCDVATGACVNDPIAGCGDPPTVTAVPSNATPAAGETLTVEIVVDTQAPLGAYSLNFSCDETVAEIVGAVFGGTTLEFSGQPLQNLVGPCSVNLTSFQALSLNSPTGSVSVARVALRVLPGASTGQVSALDVTTSILSDAGGAPIPPVDVDGSITVGP